MKPSSTADGPAFLRAAENLLPQDKRLFEDPYSANILTPINRFFVIIMRSPRIWNFLMNMGEKIITGSWGNSLPHSLYR